MLASIVSTDWCEALGGATRSGRDTVNPLFNAVYATLKQAVDTVIALQDMPIRAPIADAHHR